MKAVQFPTKADIHAPALGVEDAKRMVHAFSRAIADHEAIESTAETRSFEGMREHARLLRALAYAQAELVYAEMVAHAITVERARREAGAR